MRKNAKIVESRNRISKIISSAKHIISGPRRFSPALREELNSDMPHVDSFVNLGQFSSVQQQSSAAIIKVGRHLPRIRALLDDLGLADRAQYVEHATMDRQVVSPLVAVSEAAAPYFSMILIHKRGAAWS